MIYSLLIINKAGGLIYNREYNEGLSRLSSNDYLVLAGTFHGYFSLAFAFAFRLKLMLQHSFDNSTTLSNTRLVWYPSPGDRCIPSPMLSNFNR